MSPAPSRHGRHSPVHPRPHHPLWPHTWPTALISVICQAAVGIEALACENSIITMPSPPGKTYRPNIIPATFLTLQAGLGKLLRNPITPCAWLCHMSLQSLLTILSVLVRTLLTPSSTLLSSKGDMNWLVWLRCSWT